ncbi:MAG: ester cyclase [Flavobacteriaceae bacterium]|nr:ester cyclase [Flavobacteriaceae bacterium]MDZ4148684.1 ester cyclase [Flavobacteriaceae bacterium]
MKKLVFMGLAIVLSLSSCNQKQRYTQQSSEIETLKAAISDYEAGNWEAFSKHFADTVKIYTNSEKNHLSIDQSIKLEKQNLVSFSSYKIKTSPSEFEMVVTDKGDTWVNFWGVWQGVLIANNQQVDVPMHMTLQFIDGKIVEEHDYYDSTPIRSALQKIEAAAAEAAQESSTEN